MGGYRRAMRFSFWTGNSHPWAEILDACSHAEATGWDAATGRLEVSSPGGGEILEVARVVLATGASPDTDLATELAASEHAAGLDIVTVGDAKEPRNLATAIDEAFRAALAL